jgi:hypothetical protein
MPITRAYASAAQPGNAFLAGKNKIINGDFAINQRAFSSSTTTLTYGFDRWTFDFSGGTVTYSAQTFSAGAAPMAGYEAINFARLVTASQSANSNYAGFTQRIEDVRTLAGQTATISFWAKASTGTPNIGVDIAQVFGTGGSATVLSSAVTTKVTAVSSSWTRYSLSFTIPSISGKTIGTSSYLALFIWTSVGTTISGSGYAAVGLQNVTIDIWGVQLEAGSVATPFQTATGTLQGELAACRRYYFQTAGGVGNISGSSGSLHIQHPGMRTAPSVSQSSAITLTIWGVGDYASGGTVSLSFTNTADWSPVTVPSLAGSPTNQAVCVWRSGGSLQFSSEL